MKQTPKAGLFAQAVFAHKGDVKSGRVFVEAIFDQTGNAAVRFDCGDRPRSVAYNTPLTAIDFGHIGWDGWKVLN